jgi:hypothetical protein
MADQRRWLSPDGKKMSPKVKTYDQLLPHNGDSNNEIAYLREQAGQRPCKVKRINLSVKNLSKVRCMGRLSKMAIAVGGLGLAAVIGVGPACSSPTSATSSIRCGSSDPAHGGQVLSGTITKNVRVPADQYCSLQWAHVAGNVSVDGVLSSSATIFDHNVGVNGPGSQLWLFNYASHIKGNLSVTSSSGGWNGTGRTSFVDNTDSVGPYGNPAGGSQVDGSFSFQNNTGSLYVGSPLNVGSFTASGNGPYANPAGQFDYSGHLTVSGSPISVPSY